MNDVLKPCPLCGGKGIFYEIRGKGHIVQCESCGLTTPPQHIRPRVEQVWNGKVRIKTWSKAVIPWEPLQTTEEREFSKGTLDYRSNVSAVKIEMLDIRVRLFNRLHGSGIRTVGDILLKTPEEIKNIRLLGTKAYKELTEKLKAILEKEVYEEWMRKGAKI
jgi:RNA polymerase, alpha subunit C-terminal domain protein